MPLLPMHHQTIYSDERIAREQFTKIIRLFNLLLVHTFVSYHENIILCHRRN